MRRKGLKVVLFADNEKDDRRLRRIAKRYNRPLSAGFGMRRIEFDLPDDITILQKILCVVWGAHEGNRLTMRLIAVIQATYNTKEKK